MYVENHGNDSAMIPTSSIMEMIIQTRFANVDGRVSRSRRFFHPMYIYVILPTCLIQQVNPNLLGGLKQVSFFTVNTWGNDPIGQAYLFKCVAQPAPRRSRYTSGKVNGGESGTHLILFRKTIWNHPPPFSGNPNPMVYYTTTIYQNIMINIWIKFR